MESIGLDVGFGDKLAFRRAFKAAEGVNINEFKA